MIKVIMELELTFPYKISMGILVEFCYLWDSSLISGGTQKIKAIIAMPSDKFKKIFGANAEKKRYSVPKGMESFVSNIIVKEIK